MAMYTIQGVVADVGVTSTLGVIWSWARAGPAMSPMKRNDSASALAATLVIQPRERTTRRILAVDPHATGARGLVIRRPRSCAEP